MSRDAIRETLLPVIEHIKTLDLSDAQAARESLSAKFPMDAEFGDDLRALANTALGDGSICDREAGPSQFSRVAKPDQADGYSIDAVALWGDGPWHKHTKGEVNAMLALEGAPTFCGHREGWAVFPPGSDHVPSVKDGKMLIFYMLPDGAVEWKRTE